MSRQLPAPFLQRMQALLGEEYASFLAEYKKEPTRALLLNTRWLTEERFVSLVDFPVQPIAHLAGGYSFAYDRIGNHPLHHAGAFYVQDPSAMATVSAAPLTEGMRVLDLCASPGGKTVQLACGIGESGFLVSNEINPSRCKILCGNIERMGFSNVQVTNADVKRVASWYPSFFDLVLVDAPCSGEGMFRKYDNASDEWSENAPAFCAARQLELLAGVEGTVAPGGYLLYATCTFSPEENEQTVRRFLDKYPAYTLCELPARLCEVSAPGIDMEQARRFYPHLAPGEGQFVALLRKEGETRIPAEPQFPDGRRMPDVTEWNAARDFLEDCLPASGDQNLCAVGKHLVLSTHPAPRENLFSAGVTLGTVEKRRLIPHHQLFKALGHRFYRKLELSLSDPRLHAYLSGAEIDCDLPNGWAVVTVGSCVLGGIKVSDGRAKNHYPKGLRIQN